MIKLFDNKTNGRISKWVLQKKSTPNFPKNEHFLPLDTHTCVCVSKKCLFFWKFGVPCFLVTPALRFALLPYCRWVVINQARDNYLVRVTCWRARKHYLVIRWCKYLTDNKMLLQVKILSFTITKAVSGISVKSKLPAQESCRMKKWCNSSLNSR